MQKLTQRDYFNMIIALAEENGRTDLVDFAKSRIDVLDKKAANKKATKNQEANEELKGVISSVLATFETPATVSEIMAKSEELSALSNQKVSAVLRLMIADNTVVKTVDKKKSLFALA